MAETTNSSAAGAPHERQPEPRNSGQQAESQNIIVQVGGRRLSRTLCWIGWTGFAVCVLFIYVQSQALQEYFDTTGDIQEKFHSGDKYAQDKVAIISIKGAILDGSGYVRTQIDRVRDDEKVKAVVVRVESPGGTVYGSDYIYHHLRRLREEKEIPLIVSMGSIAASGGYYVAMAVGDQEKSIYAEPMTTTGSIGVIIPHYDVSGLLARFDVKEDSLVSHPRKQLLSMTRPISDDHRELLQAHLEEAFGRFKGIIKEGRPAFRMDPEALDQLATGEVFTALQAQKHGLVDEIGFIEDAVDRAMALANLNKKKTRVVEFESTGLSLEIPLLLKSDSRGIDLATWLDLNAPRVYYLATTLPPFMIR